MARAKTVVTWVMQVLFGLLFILIGIGKFGDPSWARSFARWGFPDGAYMVVGVLEGLGGLCLLVPRLASHAAALLMVVMAGAAVTHLVHQEWQRLTAPLVFLVILTILWWLRRSSALGLSAPSRDATGAPRVV